MNSKPKILVYRNQPLPISETFVYNQSVNLNRYEAFFLGAKRPKGPYIKLPSKHVFLINNGDVGGWVMEAIFKLFGYIPHDVQMWISSIRPAIIHAHFGPDGAIAMPIAKYFKTPLIVSFHGIDATMKDNYVRHSYITHRLYLLRRLKLSHSAARIITQSEFLKDVLVHQQGFPKKKVSIIRYGIDLGTFNLEGIHPEWGNILYVGRLIERKGLHFLIKALHIVKEKYPRVRLDVIGDGPERENYEALAEQELGKNFEFLGAQPNHVVRDYLKSTYIFSMPSITMPSGEVETLGLVFLEAQAMKVPVVSFSTGGVPEVVLNEKTGFLAKEGSVEELAHYLIVLLENSTLRRQMGSDGRKWVEKNFDLKSRNKELEDLYDDVLAKWRMHLELK